MGARAERESGDVPAAWPGQLSRRSSLGVIAGGLAAGLARPPADAWAANAPPPSTWPNPNWVSKAPTAAGFDPVKLQQAITYASSKGGSGFVVRSGWQIASWGSMTQTFDIKSATKGFGGMILGLALADGLVTLLDHGVDHLPEFGVPPTSNVTTGWLPLITLEQLVIHTAGFDEPGGLVPLLFQPGTYLYYSNAGANWLADVLTVKFKADLLKVLQQRILIPIGITSTKDLTWRRNVYRPKTLHGLVRREFGAGIIVNAPALARVGLLLLRRGQWQGQQVLPPVYVNQAFLGRPDLGSFVDYGTKKSADLRNYWMYVINNTDRGSCPDLPADTFFFWGKYDNHVLVVPSLDLVVARVAPPKGFGDTLPAINKLFRGFVQALGWVPPVAARPQHYVDMRPLY